MELYRGSALHFSKDQCFPFNFLASWGTQSTAPSPSELLLLGSAMTRL